MSTLKSALFPQKTVKEILKSKQNPTSKVTASGWVRSLRNQKDISFIQICDGTTTKPLQAILNHEKLNSKDLDSIKQTLKQITTGTSITLNGRMISSSGKGQEEELLVESMKVEGSCVGKTYPLTKSGLPFEFLRENLHLRHRSKTFGAVSRLRSGLIKEIHDYFEVRSSFSRSYHRIMKDSRFTP